MQQFLDKHLVEKMIEAPQRIMRVRGNCQRYYRDLEIAEPEAKPQWVIPEFIPSFSGVIFVDAENYFIGYSKETFEGFFIGYPLERLLLGYIFEDTDRTGICIYELSPDQSVGANVYAIPNITKPGKKHVLTHSTTNPTKNGHGSTWEVLIGKRKKGRPPVDAWVELTSLDRADREHLSRRILEIYNGTLPSVKNSKALRSTPDPLSYIISFN